MGFCRVYNAFAQSPGRPFAAFGEQFVKSLTPMLDFYGGSIGYMLHLHIPPGDNLQRLEDHLEHLLRQCSISMRPLQGTCYMCMIPRETICSIWVSIWSISFFHNYFYGTCPKIPEHTRCFGPRIAQCINSIFAIRHMYIYIGVHT